jgi:integrase/recombinase XerD
MKPTDLSIHVTSFLTHHLAAQRNLSPNTIRSYRDVFTLFLRFCRDVRGIAPEKLRLEQIDVSLVEAFLDHLETERNSSPRTRNHRLATLHAFFRYVQAEEPAYILQCQKILAIPLRRHVRPVVGYLSKEELAELLAQPDVQTLDGRRDAVLLSVLYDTGARVQELIDLSVGDVRLDSPAQLRLLGKGRKMRAVPLMNNTVQLPATTYRKTTSIAPNNLTSLSSRMHATSACPGREFVIFFKSISPKRNTNFQA